MTALMRYRSVTRSPSQALRTSSRLCIGSPQLRRKCWGPSPSIRRLRGRGTPPRRHTWRRSCSNGSSVTRFSVSPTPNCKTHSMRRGRSSSTRSGSGPGQHYFRASLSSAASNRLWMRLLKRGPRAHPQKCSPLSTVYAPTIDDRLDLKTTLTAVRKIDSERVRAAALIGLEPHLPEPDRAEVRLEIAAAADRTWKRSRQQVRLRRS